MRKFITSIPAATVLSAFTTAINNAVAPFNPFRLNLSPEERKNSRSMAEGREGYVRLVSRVATQYPNSLSRVDVPTDLSNLLAYYDQLESNRLAVLQALEVIEDIQLGASADIMTLVDRYVKSLQVSRANEGALDLAMKEVDDWNSRYGRNTVNTETAKTS